MALHHKKIKRSKFLCVTVKVFHSLAIPTILKVLHFKPQRDNYQKHPVVTLLKLWISSFTLKLLNHQY